MGMINIGVVEFEVLSLITGIIRALEAITGLITGVMGAL